MALDQSALLELSEALRSADGGELMRRLLYTMLQAVIDAEATAHIGAGRTSAPPPARPSATAAGRSWRRPPPAI
jgi:transposase-like protein